MTSAVSIPIHGKAGVSIPTVDVTSTSVIIEIGHQALSSRDGTLGTGPWVW